MLKQGIRTKSSYSAHTGANCTTVLDTGSSVEFTDSKFGNVPGYAASSPALTVSRSDFAGMVATVKAGACDGYGG